MFLSLQEQCLLLEWVTTGTGLHVLAAYSTATVSLRLLHSATSQLLPLPEWTRGLAVRVTACGTNKSFSGWGSKWMVQVLTLYSGSGVYDCATMCVMTCLPELNPGGPEGKSGAGATRPDPLCRSN